MSRGHSWAALAVLPLLAGCLTATAPPVPDLGAKVPLGLFAPALDTALWNDPQLFPHPAYNWPTVTHVPVDAPVWWQPIAPRALPTDVRGMKHLVQAGNGGTGDGIALFGRLAVVPGEGAPAQILDISDPTKPKVLSSFDVQPAARQVVVQPYPDGHLYAAFATGSGVVPIWDITDPAKPIAVTSFHVPSGGHTIAFVPGTPILYNANAVGSRYYPHEASGGHSIQQVEIYDLSNIEEPKLVQEWKNAYGCHEISFYINPSVAKLRAYCAAVDSTQIWDIQDPLHPTVLVTIPMPHGQNPVPGYPILVAVSHYVIVNKDATVMGIADEFLGGAGPGCDVHADVGGNQYSGPFGDVWFFDIHDETKPVLKGWINPGSHFTYNAQGGGTACTAHIGHMVPQEKRDVAAMSFYGGGVGLIDFTDPAKPAFLDTWQTAEPMDVWYNAGYLFAGDATTGIDVLALT